MRENYLGAVISILVHSCVMLLLAAASFTVQNRAVEVIEVDFSLTKALSEGVQPKAVKGKKTRIINAKEVPQKIVMPDPPATENQGPFAMKGLAMSARVPTIITAAADAQSETVIREGALTSADFSGPASALQTHGGSANGMEGSAQRGEEGSESLAEGGKDYNYIRDAIMKNIKYPESAQRWGFEGKVLLSFIVLENGTTSEIKVIGSSGHRLLDESAKEAVAGTRMTRDLPYRVVVRLPISYRLQGAKNGRT